MVVEQVPQVVELAERHRVGGQLESLMLLAHHTSMPEDAANSHVVGGRLSMSASVDLGSMLIAVISNRLVTAARR
jgi:hypothetical protein